MSGKKKKGNTSYRFEWGIEEKVMKILLSGVSGMKKKNNENTGAYFSWSFIIL